MPANHCLGLHEDENVGPSRPQPAKRDPEPAVSGSDVGTPTAAGERSKLLLEGQVLDHEFAAVAEGRAKGAEERQEKVQHGEISIATPAGNVNDLRIYELWRRTSWPS